MNPWKLTRKVDRRKDMYLSKTVFKSRLFHGLVVPFGTSWMVQVDRPLVLVPLVPRRSEDPLLLVPTVPLRSEDPYLLVHLSHDFNLSQLVPFGCTTCPLPTLFSQIFFWVSQCHSIFRKTDLNEKFFSKYYHVGEGINDKKIYGKSTFSSDLSPLCQWDQKIFAIWYTVVEPFRCAVYRCFRTKSQERDKKNPTHEILTTVLYHRDPFPCATLVFKTGLLGLAQLSITQNGTILQDTNL